MFVNNFIQFAPSERPLLLLQDGAASAHITIQLIDKAIEENIILLCFPSGEEASSNTCTSHSYEQPSKRLHRPRSETETNDLVHEEHDRPFDQEDLMIAASRGKLLLTSECADVESHCDERMTESQLPASIGIAKPDSQLSQLGQLLKLKDCTPKKVSELADIREIESDVVRALLSEAAKRVKLVQSQPSASDGRAFSCLRRVKTYLRSTMTQSRHTHMIVINMNRVYLDRICLPKILNDFVAKSTERHAAFGKF